MIIPVKHLKESTMKEIAPEINKRLRLRVNQLLSYRPTQMYSTELGERWQGNPNEKGTS